MHVSHFTSLNETNTLTVGPKKKKEKKGKAEEDKVEESGKYLFFAIAKLSHLLTLKYLLTLTEYDSMDLEMLREVVPMLRQQLEKSMLDRNYVQLERVSYLKKFIV